MPETTGPETAGSEPTGRSRLRSALTAPPSRRQLVAALLLAVLGFAAVVQVRANDRNGSYVGARQSDLIQLINQLSLASQRADQQISRLQQTRSSLRNDADSSRTAVVEARKEAQTLGILAGTVAAVGPGVRVTVRDPRGSVGTDQMLNGIQELRDAGAEAMEIDNTVRVVAQTWIKDGANGGIVVDGRRLVPPYTIDAIGDPHTLATALAFRGGFSYGVRTVGGQVQVQQSRQIQIGATRKAPEARYAR